jgi:hypothetical protein
VFVGSLEDYKIFVAFPNSLRSLESSPTVFILFSIDTEGCFDLFKQQLALVERCHPNRDCGSHLAIDGLHRRRRLRLLQNHCPCIHGERIIMDPCCKTLPKRLFGNPNNLATCRPEVAQSKRWCVGLPIPP